MTIDLPNTPRFVQIRNPRTGLYVKIDRERGVIVSHKKTRGPFRHVAHAKRRAEP